LEVVSSLSRFMLRINIPTILATMSALWTFTHGFIAHSNRIVSPRGVSLNSFRTLTTTKTTTTTSTTINKSTCSKLAQEITISTTALSATDCSDVTKSSQRLSSKDLSLDQRTVYQNLPVVLSHLKSRRASEETCEAARQVAALNERRVELIKIRDLQLNIRNASS
jgi:hypothetical protein